MKHVKPGTMTSRFFIFTGILCLCFSQLRAQTQDDTRTDFDGIWLYNGDNLTRSKTNALKHDKPFISGGMIAVKWSELQPQQNNFLWSLIDTPLDKLADTGLYAELMIWAGPDAPDWIYQYVDSVKTDDQDHTWDKYPAYLDPDYKLYWFRMMDSVAAHIAALPASQRNRVLIYQSAEGTTGDATAFKGSSTDTGWFGNSSPKWMALREAAWKHLDTLYGSSTPKIHLLLNQGGGFELNSWINTNIPLAWRKDPGGGHIYQANYETNDRDSLNNIINVPVGNCAARVRARDEQDNHYHSAAFFKHQKWWYMSTAQSALQIGLDLWFIQSDIQVNNFDSAFKFFAKYAGQKDPSCSPAAYCALRDGLDAWDTVRFPKNIYGNIGTDALDTVRCKAIANSFAANGASQDDPAVATSDINGPAGQRDADGLNDVGWKIFPGNYERFLHQLDAGSTSVGYWRLGDTSTVYGRFARGTKHNAGKDTLLFDLNDNFYTGTGSHTAVFHIVYYDSGTGKWSLYYDANTNPQKKALTMTKKGSNTWKDTTVTVTDGYFGNRQPHSADFVLLNTDTDDDIFALVEVSRATGSRPTGIGTAEQDDNDILLSPNPVTDALSITLPADGKKCVLLTDMTGRVMADITTDAGNTRIGTDKLLPGVYFIRVRSGDHIWIKKLLKL